MKDKRALVTGGCGASGMHMVRLLMDKGYRIRATDLDEPTSIR